MHPHRLFWIAFGVLAAGLGALLAAQALLFAWVHAEALAALPPRLRNQLAAFLAAAWLTWLAVIAVAVWALIQRYVVPWHRLRESVEAALQAPTGSGIHVEGGPDPQGLADALSELERGRKLSETRLAEARARAVEEVEQERSRLRAMLDRSRACVVTCDAQGWVTAYSRGAWERLGPTAGLGLGRPIDHLVDPQLMLFAFDALLKQATAGVPDPDSRFRVGHANGRHWEVRAEPVGEEGPLTGFVLTFEEVREENGNGAAALQETREGAPPAPAVRVAPPGPIGEATLAGLRYVVFDTETTGLHPSQGDEVVALGAVAVAQGRIVEEECFERLVDPGRPIQPSALRVHGITAEMVTGCPPLTEILPEFARFAEGAVLVAHNAAFDMRFLRLKERSAGVRFTQPVLDTMLLSAVLHPHQRSHSLDSLIGRYGVAVRKRHSAKGDAMMTAEVLLKLLPLLERRGIGTLEAALRASRRVPLARLIY